MVTRAVDAGVNVKLEGHYGLLVIHFLIEMLCKSLRKCGHRGGGKAMQ
jgi:hypothetical protein